MPLTDHPSLILSGGKGTGGTVRGPALVSTQGFGVRYDLDLETGIIGNRDHDLYGEPIKDRVLVFTKPKGGVAASWALAKLTDMDIGPLAIIFRSASPIFAQGALFAGIPILHCLKEDPCSLLHSGDELVVNAEQGIVEVYR